MQDSIETLNEQIAITLPRGAWNVIKSIIYKSATCEVGNPLLEAITTQIAQAEQMRNGNER